MSWKSCYGWTDINKYNALNSDLKLKKWNAYFSDFAAIVKSDLIEWIEWIN